MMISRVYHPVNLWEEVNHNMWGDVINEKQALALAIKFTSDHKLYGQHMLRVVSEWPVSAENALTDPYLNKKAWVGHAAVALALNIPEDITRKAWGFLTDEQRLLANREAERAIQQWQLRYTKSERLRKEMGIQMLF